MLQKDLISPRFCCKKINGRSGPEDTPGSDPVDEVSEYIQCRYICEHDAFWRIFGFNIHTKFPIVERLPVHLTDLNIVHIDAVSAEVNLFSFYVL